MINQQFLRERLDYELLTGAWTWRAGHQKVRIGDVAGSTDTRGHRQIRLCGKLYAAHRLAWLWMTGCWPWHEIDHINGKRADNRWSNLREATHSQNSANRSLRADNKCGLKGVSWHPQRRKYVASIFVNNKQIYLGSFDSRYKAASWYHAFALLAFGEFAPAT